MTPYNSKKELCKELTNMARSYPRITVKELTEGTKNCQEAYYKAIQVTSKIINNGDTSGSVSNIYNCNIKNLSIHTYIWNDLERRHELISAVPTDKHTMNKSVNGLKNYGSVTKILIGGYCVKRKQYLNFDLDGNGYTFPVDVKLSKCAREYC